MQHQVEVRNITKKISDLNCKLDTVSTLSEPRENFYIEFKNKTAPSPNPDASDGTCDGASDDDGLSDLLERVAGEIKEGLGRVKTSRTLPSLCR